MISFIYPCFGAQQTAMGDDILKNYKITGKVIQEISDNYGKCVKGLLTNANANKLEEDGAIALYAFGCAINAVLKQEYGIDFKKNVSFVAGHGIGEYAALQASEVITTAMGAKLLKVRQHAIDHSIKKELGGMLLVIGMDVYLAYELAAQSSEDDVCQLSVHNCPSQIMISGHNIALRRFIMASKEKSPQAKIFKINISYPAHCALMLPVAGELDACLETTPLAVPQVPIIFNYTARSEKDPEKVAGLLVKQAYNRVLWNDIIKYIAKRKTKQIVEIGPGNYLTKTTKRINPAIAANDSLCSKECIDKLMKSGLLGKQK